jgi:hypothetical protein
MQSVLAGGERKAEIFLVEKHDFAEFFRILAPGD